MSEFIAIIHKDKSSAYGASFPDLPGCISVAQTLEELRPMVEEAFGFHIEGMMEDGETIPAPSPLDAIISTPDYKNAVAIMVVKAPQKPETTVRVNITMPERTLEQIDRRASEMGLSRSGFLVQAAKTAMREAG